jgi:hypothetical protein
MSAPPSDGFLNKGDLHNVFGLSNLNATLYAYSGPTPTTIALIPDRPPVYEIAKLDAAVKQLSAIIPQLAGTPFHEMPFTNFAITRQSYQFDPTKPIGWSISADLVIDKSTGALYDIMNTTLGMQTPAVHVQMYISPLSDASDWTAARSIDSFTLEGILPGMHASVGGMGLHDMGVRLIGSSISAHATYSINLFGILHLQVPGSTTPLELDFKIEELLGDITLSATNGDVWNGAFGIKGLRLNSVALSMKAPLHTPLSSTFSVQAELAAGTATASLAGTFSASGFSLSAPFARLDWTGISDIVYAMTNDTPSPPEIEIVVGSATLDISSTSGVTITVHDLHIDQWRIVDALLSIGPGDLVLRGSVVGNVSFEGIAFQEAYGQVSVGRSSVHGKTEVMIGGIVSFHGLEIHAGAHLYYGPAIKSVGNASPSSPLEFTVFGTLTTTGKSLAISALEPKLKGTFVDFVLLDAAFVIASQADADISQWSNLQLPIQKGLWLST